MKDFLRAIFVNGVTLTLTAQIFPGLSYSHDLKILFFTSLTFTLINLCLQPLVKLLLLPINLLTLGMFRWLTGVICLFLLTILVPEVKIRSFTMPAFSQGGFATPQFYFSTLMSLITASFLISLISTSINWLIKK